MRRRTAPPVRVGVAGQHGQAELGVGAAARRPDRSARSRSRAGRGADRRSPGTTRKLPGMRVGVQQPVLEHLGAEAADEDLEQPVAVARARLAAPLAGVEVVDQTLAGEVLEHQDARASTARRGRAARRRRDRPRSMRAKARGMRRLGGVVELGAHRARQLGGDRLEVEERHADRAVPAPPCAARRGRSRRSPRCPAPAP